MEFERVEEKTSSQGRTSSGFFLILSTIDFSDISVKSIIFVFCTAYTTVKAFLYST
jgi:hypothetical protein